MQDLISLEKIINSELNTKINSTYIKHNELRLNVDPGDIMEVVLFLKNNPSTKFRQLIDVTAVDYPNSEKRFRLVYLLLSLENNKRISIDYYIKENDLVSSITAVFPSANWMEREVFDMYGINFKDHPDLRRILTDYGFEGYPLRKDFPLTGNVEVRYDEMEKKVIYEPVKLQQDYRNFDTQSPWEGTDYVENKEKE